MSVRILVALLTVSVLAADKPARSLEIIYSDTEGGAATLIVTPAGESVLIDCGNPGARDAERIHAAAKHAGLERIDHMIVTHWHTDHYGGLARLAELIPIDRFYHHGIPESLSEDKTNFPVLIQAYRKAAGNRAVVLKPGDTVPLKRLDGTPELSLFCVCGNGEVIPDKLGAPENPDAKGHTDREPDTSDNAKSLGVLLRYGKFRFLDLGDLTWNAEYKLVHPTDKIGPVDVFQVNHHGLEVSNCPALLRTVKPRVAVFNNGPRKGGHPRVIGDLRRLAEPPTIFQMHRNVTSGPAENTELTRIANDGKSGERIVIRVSADSASYTVKVADKPEESFKTR